MIFIHNNYKYLIIKYLILQFDFFRPELFRPIEKSVLLQPQL